MKIVNAIWEKQNIGVDTIEIAIEPNDLPEDVIAKIKTLDAEYMVVKVPSDFASVSFDLAAQGFVFIETMHTLESDLQLKPVTDLRKQQILNETQFVEMNDQDHQEMTYHIMNDLMFRTDRVGRDPHFTLKDANRRYVNWLASERAHGTHFYKYVYRNKNVGFECFSDKDGVYDRILYGIYREHEGKHLSINCTHKLNELALQQDGRKIITHIASSNVRSLKTHVNNGFVISQSTYVFVRHRKANGLDQA